ncbi:MAG TPA: CHAP domain-containing protein [Ktedonobacteraceae bacterium]|nr:CHAP domain-containing protein [Ktedonobacteraceae bacterium]
MPDRPRSLSGLRPYAGLGPVVASAAPSSAEELPTTPLPAISAQFDQADTTILPAQYTPVPPTLARQLSNPDITQQLSGPRITRQLSNPGVTRQLSGIGTMRSQFGIASDGAEGSSSRNPVVIKGEMKKRISPHVSPHSRTKRRLLVSASGVLILFMVTGFALLVASPLGHNMGLNLSGQPTGTTLIAGNSNDVSLISQATATAVSYQHNDGYDPYSNGGVTITDGSGSLNWPVGQCTFWANYRYHELTGHWVSWSGNAAQWVAGARQAGWNVSSDPHVPSIIVLMPYVQGAYGYGHVAVVESVNDNASPVTVHTSNMNWFNGGGGWDKESTYDFTVGTGVYFVWK